MREFNNKLEVADQELALRREAASFNQSAAANRRPALQSGGSRDLSATLAADRAFPAAVGELGSLDEHAIQQPFELC